ncbi:mannose-1-phosphate guanylyltransferase/mannose-6-phosphate isomerase [Pseudomonas sp. F3-2]|uniref:mannose-1-phosphate guanylyltransferase/mannose-6-phosphate isomerase n=1 Tax=Pseudomonas sp. F3-2 TaxID=3141539 RepID=UPI00315CCDCE
MFYPVILAGGSGSRLWPQSRHLNPKQFLPLVDPEVSMLQSTVGRLTGYTFGAPIVICNEEHRFLAAEQLRHLKGIHAHILLEPEGRNTAPAVALAALHALEFEDDPTLLVLPADHFIGDVSAFHSSLADAERLADNGKLVTFGIVPTYAETGYGYLKSGEPSTNSSYLLDQFVEKPDRQHAEEFVSKGGYYWNSGMFMFKARRYLAELDVHAPAIASACRASMASARKDLDFVRVGVDAFVGCKSDSIDYAVMEHTQDAVVLPLKAGWSDIGSWSALWDIGEKDSANNVVVGDVVTEASKNSYISANHRLVATLGVDNLIIVETKDAVLVAQKDCVQDVKRIVAQLEEKGRQEHLEHREVYRPWGVYDSIDQGPRYQVKRITVNPGAKLSVQKHHHRAEHWIVVSGTAQVTNGEDTYLVTENQSTYIPIGQIHALENPGVIPLELIEVQSGSYLGEDDIVRFEDKYGRVKG